MLRFHTGKAFYVADEFGNFSRRGWMACFVHETPDRKRGFGLLGPIRYCGHSWLSIRRYFLFSVSEDYVLIRLLWLTYNSKKTGC